MPRLAVVALVLLVAACGGSDDDEPASPTTLAPVETTTTQAAASIEQVASVIAQHRGELENVLSDRAACDAARDGAVNLDGSTNTDLTFIADQIECKTSLITADTALLLLMRDLGKVRPPAEVASLHGSTRAAAARARTENGRYSSCLDRSEKDGGAYTVCSLTEGYTAAADEVLRKLAGWDAYL